MELLLVGAELKLLPQRTLSLVQVAVVPTDAKVTDCPTCFHIGPWAWYLRIMFGEIRLYPSSISLHQTWRPKSGSLSVRFLVKGSNRPIHIETANDYDFSSKLLYTKTFGEIRVPTEGFIVEVEFYDLKISSPDDKEPRSIWTLASTKLIYDSQKFKARVTRRMLDEDLDTDVTINTSDSGIVSAHRAILVTGSIVFDKIFTHNIREPLPSTISVMMHMTLQECRALLSYVYGILEHKDMEEHASALLKAASTYDMADLKEICKAHLIEGINTSNVLSRLRDASDHELHELKQDCKYYLLDCGRIWEMKEEVSEFIRESNRHVDDELGVELVRELITRMPLAAFQGLPFSKSPSPERPSRRKAS